MRYDIFSFNRKILYSNDNDERRVYLNDIIKGVQLKKTETEEKNSLPTKEDIEKEKKDHEAQSSN